MDQPTDTAIVAISALFNIDNRERLDGMQQNEGLSSRTRYMIRALPGQLPGRHSHSNL